MYFRLTPVLLSSTILLFSLGTAAAQSIPEQCGVALVPNVDVRQLNDRTRLSYLNLINQSNFQEAKSSARLGAELLVNNTPLSAFANFDDFSRSRSEYLSRLEFQMDRDLSITYFHKHVSADAFRAFRDCLELTARGGYGLRLIPIGLDDDVVRFSLYYRPTPSAEQLPIRVDLDLRDGEVDSVQSAEIRPHEFVPIIYRRNSAGGVVRITASGGGLEPASFRVPAVDPPACRHPNHGVELFGRVYDDVLRHTGGSGTHPDEVCGWLRTALVRDSPPGSRVTFKSMGTASDSRGHHHHCIMTVERDPVYLERVTDACRVTPRPLQ